MDTSIILRDPAVSQRLTQLAAKAEQTLVQFRQPPEDRRGGHKLRNAALIAGTLGAAGAGLYGTKAIARGMKIGNTGPAGSVPKAPIGVLDALKLGHSANMADASDIYAQLQKRGRKSVRKGPQWLQDALGVKAARRGGRRAAAPVAPAVPTT
jgi:hypothetical protein